MGKWQPWLLDIKETLQLFDENKFQKSRTKFDNFSENFFALITTGKKGTFQTFLELQ